MENFESVFGKKPGFLFSAPGRTELSGNHTDHQHGRVLAAAVNLDTKAEVRENGENVIRVFSRGFGLSEIDLTVLEPQEEEKGSTRALIRGVAAAIAQRGFELHGFDAYVWSNVLPGSGLSSSAAFEVLIGTILNHLCSSSLTPVEIAQIGQYAENVFFGKPCGLMDQTASSVGNVVTIDFEDNSAPVVTPIDFDFASCGYSLCIIDSGADHADLTDEYAAIPGELKAVCRSFGKEFLREIPEDEFYAGLVKARAAAGDRAILRAIHIYEENKRVAKQADALANGDFEGFLSHVKASGDSSWMYLQNVIPTGNTSHQELALAIALCDKLLGGRGACRVHGGGFAGTLQAFVPVDMLDGFKNAIESVLGEGSCHVLSIRPEGGVLLEVYND